MQNELRKSYDSEDETIISPIAPSSVGCILCPQLEMPDSIAPKERLEETYRIESKGKNGVWLCRSIVDPYPVTHPTMFKPKENSDILQSYAAHGWSEVVIETRDHQKELHELSSEEIKNVLTIYAHRIKELRKKENVAHVCVIKDNIHSEFNHSYSKIITLPIVPRKTKEKMTKFNDYHYKHDDCLYCDILKKEKLTSRNILENEQFIVLATYAQDMPYEVIILPKKHYTCLSEMNEFEIFTLAETLKNILTRMSAVVNPLKYSMSFHLRPNQEKDFHFHISVGQKTLRPTLNEGYGINLSKISSEDTAKMLKG